jgi:nucleoside-diphosphate-sugar epimerase
MSEEATVLITGGTGFVGSYTVAAINDTGADVVAFDLSEDTTTLEKLGVKSEVEFRQGDVSDPLDVLQAAKETGATHIVHLASLLTPASRANPRKAMQVNIVGTNNVLEAAKTLDEQVERVSWASSLAVYAPDEEYDVDSVSESELLGPETLYGATKVYNEHQAEHYQEQYDISTVGIRPTLVYGPYRMTGITHITDIIEQPARGESYSMDHGDQIMDWVHIEDVADAFKLATFAPEEDLSQQVYNISGERGTIREAAGIVKDLLPGVDLTITDDGSYSWNFKVDRCAAEEDLGYEPTYKMRNGFRHYIKSVQNEFNIEESE